MYGAIRRFYEHKRNDWHEQRADLFVSLMRPGRGVRILDLGGGNGEFMERVRARIDVDVTVADINERALQRAREAGFTTVTLDEAEQLPFADGAFDIVFCNSVIEHVTLPKAECVARDIPNAEWASRSRRAQSVFAAELSRVAKRYFVQTPHRAFPIESHTWLPFVGWLTHEHTVKLVRLSDRFWVKECGYVDWHLFGAEELQQLLPTARIHVERVLGMPKSLIAYSC